MNAPLVDTVIGQLPLKADYIDADIYRTLVSIYQHISLLPPGESDDYRSVWLEVLRGSIGDFGDFESYRDDGEVETYEEFETLWKDWYPDETKWYQFATSKYKTDLYFYLNSKLLIQIGEDSEPATSPAYVPEHYSPFFQSLDEKVQEVVEKLKSDPKAYQDYIEKNLPYSKRVGRILRKDFWEIVGDDAWRQDKNLGEDLIRKLSLLIEEHGDSEERAVIREITADDFFHYCEICYDANGYFGEDQTKLTSREKYKRMADGRHGGLPDIEGDSPGALSQWFRDGAGMGGHPWEICRGGNSTHISLYVHSVAGEWQVTLAGSSNNRVEETVRMAVALHEHGIPFDLREAEEILRMIKGEDYIGIVPEGIIPRYCHSYFPKEDRIIDFMNIDYEYRTAIEKKAYWYPLV